MAEIKDANIYFAGGRSFVADITNDSSTFRMHKLGDGSYEASLNFKFTKEEVDMVIGDSTDLIVPNGNEIDDIDNFVYISNAYDNIEAPRNPINIEIEALKMDVSVDKQRVTNGGIDIKIGLALKYGGKTNNGYKTNNASGKTNNGGIKTNNASSPT